MGFKRQMLLRVAGAAPGFWSSQLRNPVFVIGCARSGTTLLNDLMARHRDIAALSEANDVWDPSGYPWHRSARETPPIWLDPAAHTARWWRDAQPRQREIRAIFGVYQALLRKPVFLNKTPLNTFRLPFLLEIFPQARFVHLVRDGRAVTYSYTRKQGKAIQQYPDAYAGLGMDHSSEALALQLAAFWRQNIEEIERQDAALELQARGRLLTIAYRDLCADVSDTLAQISDFIGVDPARFHQDTWQVKVNNRNTKWQSAWSDTTQDRIVAQMEPTLSQWGYT